MQKAIELARKMNEDLDRMWIDEIKEINLHTVFNPIYRMTHHRLRVHNTIVCFIIYAYDNDSPRLDLRHDRQSNKNSIIKGLDAEALAIYESMLLNDDDAINDVIAEYLLTQTTWKWQQIISQIEYHAKMMRFVNQKTEEGKSVDRMDKENGGKITLTTDYDIDTITKVNKQKGELLEAALKARREADKLLAEIKAEFIQMDNAVQADFGFEPTDERKINPESWRDFIKERKKKLGR